MSEGSTRDESTRIESPADEAVGRRTGTVVIERADDGSDAGGDQMGTVAIERVEGEWLDLDEWTDNTRRSVSVGTIVRERFELQSVIGEGTMGVVYKALDRLHEEMRDRDPYVAIKILSEQFKQHPNALITLQREVRKAQALAHENIISVHNFDRDGPIVYMTMELLEGKTLRAVINEADNGLPSADAVPMIHGMAKALAYAHDNGIVHSDFKPSNVFFTRKEQIKVLDFGVARVAPTRAEPGSDTDWDPDPIEVREVGGLTPAYASPEMLQGLDPAPADDVFALAIVCYELLTGRHPFNRRPVDPQVLGDVRAKSLHGLSWSQRKALARAFSPERENRHENAGEFLKEFAGPSKTRTIAQAGVAASAALALFAVLYLPTVEPVPSVEFDELPAEVQQEFNTAVREGQRALSFGDAGINEAFFYYSLAYELHPNNQVAVIGLETVADRFLSSIRAADADTQRDVLDLLYCQDYLRSYAPVASACDDLFGPQCEAIARGCSVTRTGN